MYTIMGINNAGKGIWEENINFDGTFNTETEILAAFRSIGCECGNVYDNIGLAAVWSCSAGFTWI